MSAGTLGLIQQLQRLSCVQKLLQTLTDTLGPAPEGEENGYVVVAKMLLGNFEKAQEAIQHLEQEQQFQEILFKHQQSNSGSAPWSLLRAAFSVCLNDLGESSEPTDVTLQQVELRLKKIANKQQEGGDGDYGLAGHDDDDSDDNPPLLEPDVEEACFNELYLRLRQVDLKKAVTRGAQALLRSAAAEMAEAELRKEDQRRREQAARAAAYHNELRRLGGGATAASSASSTAGGNADTDFGIGLDLSVFESGSGGAVGDDGGVSSSAGGLALEIERCDKEPNFLRAMGVNFRERLAQAERDLRRRQVQELREKELAKRSKLGMGGARLAQLAAAASSFSGAASSLSAMGAAGGNKTSMEMAIERREMQARIQREVEKRHNAIVAQQQQQQQGGGGTSGGAPNSTFSRELGESSNTETASNLNIPWKLIAKNKSGRGGAGGGGLLPLPSSSSAAASAAEQQQNEFESAAKLAEQRRSLPIYGFRQKIVDTIRSQRSTVISAETGSGKTTQVPQYLLEEGFATLGAAQGGASGTVRKQIAVTQPRLIAAQLVAARVAKEHGCALGDAVGYTVRFDDKTSSRTLLKYMTDGVLLREALMDPTFEKYSVIILDEAHERNLNTDILFALCNAALKKNPNLRVVATSATMDVQRFCAYFGCQQPLEIPGRTFPVERVFLREPCEDYFEEALQTIMTIHVRERPGDILAFFTGKEEIENARKRLERWLEHEELRNMPPLLITRLYAGLPDEDKARALMETPPLSRKVVLSTNIAETSVTITGLYFVVDCGYCKENMYNPNTRVDTLATIPVAQSQAKQRCGRAGRTGPGKCFFLYTEHQFLNELKESTTPEIQRTNLANVVLTLKALGVQDPLSLNFMDPPPVEALVSALEQLYFLGALDGDGVLTQLGSRMSQLPVSPNESRTLLAAQELGCLDPVVTIVAMLGEQHVFHRPRDSVEEADQARLSFIAPEGDHITLLRVYEAFEEQDFDKAWCRSNFINPAAVLRCKDLRAQLLGILKQRGIGSAAAALSSSLSSSAGAASTTPLESRQYQVPAGFGAPASASSSTIMTAAGIQRSHDLVAIRKAFVAGNFYQTAKRAENAEYLSLSDRRKVSLHPTSSLFHIQPTYCLWHTVVETTKEYMREAIAVDPAWLLEMAPNFFSTPGAGKMTKFQQHTRIDPVLRANETHTGPNSWRISKMKQPPPGRRK